MTRRCDVVVVGDGPAGSALAGELRHIGVDAVLVGRDDPWTATYAGWVDDLDGVEVVSEADVWATAVDSTRLRFDSELEIARPYGVFANDELRRVLRSRCQHVTGSVTTVDSGSISLDDGSTVGGRVVVDATGWPPSFATYSRSHSVAWQTAFGFVLPEPPDGPLGTATVMDYSPVDEPESPPTFAYALPVADGWLVEETVLAARPAVEPAHLAPRLARRLGRGVDELLGTARRIEEVRIPMGAPPSDPMSPVLAFGAAGGMIQPATGYSVTASIRAAAPTSRRLADALAARNGAERSVGGDELRALHRAVWPEGQLRTRALHDFGLDVLLRLDGPGLRQFFGTFFSLSPEDRTTFLRIDSAPGDVARVMTTMFAAAPWSLRRRLVSGNPRSLARLFRR